MPKSLLVIKHLLLSLRPKHWVKNLFVFAALIFAQEAAYQEPFLKTFYAFLILCALSSAVYLFNDLADLSSDRVHPIKKNRPLAAGRLDPRLAVLTAVLLGAAGLSTGFLINFNFGLVATLYVLLNIAYSLWLKKVAILDLLAVSLGFVLRTIGGAEAITVAISPWLIVCTLFVALFIVVGKRRAEAVNNKKTEIYRSEFLDQLLVLTASITILSYVLYTINEQTVAKFHTQNLLYTTPFVVYGVFRYFYLVSTHNQGALPTETLLTDRPILINALFWATAVVIIIYLKISLPI